VSSTLAEINVVPLVDVMLVLLVIFMVTAPMIQRGIDVRLPVARNSSTVEGERVFVTIPNTYKTDGMVYVNSDRLRGEALADRIRQRLQTATDKQVYLRGDGAVQLQEFMASEAEFLSKKSRSSGATINPENRPPADVESDVPASDPEDQTPQGKP